jgi:hypothetical protein
MTIDRDIVDKRDVMKGCVRFRRRGKTGAVPGAGLRCRKTLDGPI